MTPRENFLRAARRQSHQWIPLDIGFAPGFMKVFHKHAGPDVQSQEYFKYDGRWFGPEPSQKKTPNWLDLYYSDGGLPADATIDPEWGTAKAYDAAVDDVRSFFPLRNIETLEQVDAYPWPDHGAEYRYKGLREKIEQAHKQGYASHMAGPIFFESVWNLRGFEQLMLDMALESPVASRLYERMYELQIRSAQQAAKCNSDVMMAGSDVASQRGPLMSPAMWRKYIFPMMHDCIKEAKKIKPDILVMYHSCGDVSSMVEGFIEAGIDILDPCQPEAMNIFELKRRYGKLLSFHGGIGVQSVLPFGTPDQVKEMVRKTIDIMADGGGYLCCASHTVRQEVPWENIVAMYETLQEYGHP